MDALTQARLSAFAGSAGTVKLSVYSLTKDRPDLGVKVLLWARNRRMKLDFVPANVLDALLKLGERCQEEREAHVRSGLIRLFGLAGTNKLIGIVNASR